MQNEINPVSLSHLIEKQKKCLQSCQGQIDKWTMFRDEYKELQTKLTTFPDKISYDVQVPFGSLAFMPGKILHTNEILVLLGDGWFVEQSSKQACTMVDRRIASCDESLKQLEVEREHLQNWMQKTGDIHEEMGDAVEIIEEYDEEAEKLWAERHRASVKKYKEMKDRETQVTSETANTEIFKRVELDDNLSCGSDSLLDTDREDGSSGVAEVSNQSTNKKKNDTKGKKVRFEESEVFGDTDKESQRSTLKITFTNEHEADSNVPMLGGDESSSSFITSPADIFKLFGGSSVKIPANGTKSILKQSSSLKETNLITTTSVSELQSFNDEVPTTPEQACTDVVIEHNPNFDEAKFDIDEPRRVSLFKSRGKKN